MERSVDLPTALIEYTDLILRNYGVSPKGLNLVSLITVTPCLLA